MQEETDENGTFKHNIEVSVKDKINKFNYLNATKQNQKLDIRDEKEKLLSRLRLSREELDTYIRHSKKIIEEKKVVERENAALKTQIEIYIQKIARLEKFESNLRQECSQLQKLLHEQSSHKEKDKNIETMRESLSNILSGKRNHSLEYSDDPSSQITESIAPTLKEHMDIIDQLKREIEQLTIKKTLLLSERLSDSNPKELTSTPSPHGRRRSLTTVFNNQTEPTSSSTSDGGIKNANPNVKKYLAEQLISLKGKISDLDHLVKCKIEHPVIADENKIDLTLSNIDGDDSTQVFEEYNKISELYIRQLMDRISYLDDKAYNFHLNIESLNEEVHNLKYALSHRMEMAQMRIATSSNCNCKEEIEDLKDDIRQLRKELKNKETELEVAEENRRTLLQLMASMSGNNDDDTGMDDGMYPNELEYATEDT